MKKPNYTMKDFKQDVHSYGLPHKYKEHIKGIILRRIGKGLWNTRRGLVAIPDEEVKRLITLNNL